MKQLIILLAFTFVFGPYTYRSTPSGRIDIMYRGTRVQQFRKTPSGFRSYNYKGIETGRYYPVF